MTDLLFAVLAVAVLAFAVWFAKWAGPYFDDDPTLLDAPHRAAQSDAVDCPCMRADRADYSVTVPASDPRDGA